MAESVAQRINGTGMSAEAKRDLLALINSLRLDVVAVRTDMATLSTKLNADVGVTDTNYGAAASTANTTA